MTHFKGKQFQKDIIMVAVGYYLRYNLSYREVSKIMNDRGISVCHTTCIPELCNDNHSKNRCNA